ncbi:uncharacterized protein J3R85_016564 [Psidium guajava]|nr:uncharacterized protein J3R85_016564 [Psidium guajava]
MQKIDGKKFRDTEGAKRTIQFKEWVSDNQSAMDAQCSSFRIGTHLFRSSEIALVSWQ